MAVVRLFAQARELVGAGRLEIPGTTVGEVIEGLRAMTGPEFDEVLRASRVWCNGEATEDGQLVTELDEVAVLPPFSGGAR